MVWWSSRRGARPEPGLRPSVVPTELVRVDFTDFSLDPIAFLGQAAAIQLEFFEGLARAVATAPDLRSKEGVSATAGVALRKHHELIAELRREGVEPVSVMEPFAVATERFREITSGDDWYELLLGIHVTSGILDDFFARLAEGLPSDLGQRVRGILVAGGATPVLERQLSEAISANPGLADRLALWGRRLVGDTLLIARSALRAGRDDQAAEPVFTELIAAHTRRMDVLGLTA